MKVAIIFYTIMVVIALLIGVFISKVVFVPLQKQAKEYENIISEKYIFKGDTVQVVNSSLWNEDVTLDNGITVSYDFLMKCEKVD